LPVRRLHNRPPKRDHQVVSPPTEQLVNDYLSRLSAAARGRLAPADRRALVMRTRYFIQQTAGQAGTLSPIEVARLLSGLGDPASIVAQEQERLAALRGEPAASANGRLPRSGRLFRRQQGQASWHWPSQPAGSPQLTSSLMAAAADDQAAPWQRDLVPAARFGLRFRRPGRSVGMPKWTAPGAAADGSAELPHQASASLSAADSGQNGALTGSADGDAAVVATPAELSGRPSWPSVVARTLPAGNGGTAAGTTANASSGSGGSGDGGSGDGGSGDGGSGDGGSRDGGSGDGVDAGSGAGGNTLWLNGLAFSAGADASGSQAASVIGRAEAARLIRGMSSLSGWLGQLAVRAVRRFHSQPVESAATVLLGIGGAAYPPVWLLGAAVALTSRVWDYRDKWAGLALPVLGTIVGTVVGVSLTGTSALGHDAHHAWMFADVLSRVAAVAGASFLLWRALHGRRPPAIPPWNNPHKLG
jgi:hypothetical protein